MAKKIVEVPEGTAYLVAKDSLSKWINSVPVSILKDAPKKRVIELPGSLIRTLSNIKESNTSRLMDFLNYLTYDQRYRLTKALRSQNIETPFDVELANWYLGHVEFVAKKENKFVVKRETKNSYKYVGTYQDGTITFMSAHADEDFYSETTDDGMIKTEFTEEEADKLVDGLTAVNARKVKVEEE
ncbi:hypothetical protein D0504_05395 [Weissella confusa]|uniref:hypothetical protein n=1 Tax=Weissella confusa TaxID=1583 RepID=UPI0021BFE2EC|nr:hypothetical protein [Weissella confusa]MCT8393169.1 hypothetical protein [Weissella confusa]